jgi:kynurenine formamidase
MNRRLGTLLLAGLVAACTPAAEKPQAFDISAYDLVDLSHPYDENTIYWPNSPSGFELHELSYGHVDGGWFYSSFAYSSPEHGGTHMDAPHHFDEQGQTIDDIPLSNLLGQAVVIDVSAQAAADPDYVLQVADVEAFEELHGPIAEGSIIILRTGWSKYWPDRKAYLGDDRPGRTDDLHFPSFGVEASLPLIEKRKVSMIGVDTASIDNGQSKDFMVHQIAGAANVPGLENLMNLHRLPPRGAILIALPMKIGDGSGGPVRVIALIPRESV